MYYSCVPASLQKKTDQMRNLATKVKLLESEEQARVTELEATRKNMAQLSQQQSSEIQRTRALEVGAHFLLGLKHIPKIW